MKFLSIVLLLSAAAGAQGTAGGHGQVSGKGQIAILPLPAQYSLTVTVTGIGTVTASPNGLGNTPINCPPQCVATYNTGTVVTLTEAPGSGQAFGGWGGAAAGCASATTCSLTITAITTATANFTGASGGGPTSYNGRTDGCYFNASTAASCTTGTTCASVCNPALTVGEQVSGLGALLVNTEGVSDPIPFPTLAAGAVQNTCWTDPDFGTYECWATDESVSGALATTVFTMGSDGGYDAFNNDSTLFLTQTSGGNNFLFHVVLSRFHGKTCTTANPCIIASNLHSGAPDSTHFDSAAGLVFSRNPADGDNVIFEINLPTINKLTITSGLSGGGIPTGSDSITRTLLVDFSKDMAHSGPVDCSVVPPGYNSLWNGQVSVSDVDSFTMSSGGGAPWPGVTNVAAGTGSQAVTGDNFIMPVNNLTSTGSISNIQPIIPGGTAINFTAPAYYGFVGESVTITGTTNYNGTYVLTAASNSTHNFTFVGPKGFGTETSGTATSTMNKKAFQATTPGTTGASEPNWAQNCPIVGLTCSDGTAVWTNIDGVGGQGPGFDILNYRPGIGCKRANTRLSKTYNGTGVAEPTGAWITDDVTLCTIGGGSSCGSGGTVAFSEPMTLHAGSQELDSRYGNFVPTGGGSVVKNYGGSGYNLQANPFGACTPPVNAGTPGSVFPTWPNPLWQSGYSYAKGAYSVDPTYLTYYTATAAVSSTTQPYLDPTHWKFEGSYCYIYFMQWATNIVRPCLELGPMFGCDSHGISGYQYEYHGGRYFSHFYNQPNCPAATQIINGSTVPCPQAATTGYIGGPGPGVSALSVSGCADAHPTYRNVGVLDLQPFFIPRSSVPSWPTFYLCAGYDEQQIIANLTSTGGGTPTVWRGGHNYNTGSSAIFGAQNAVGVVSQLGDVEAVTSDGMNTRGDRLVINTTCQHPLRGQYTPSVGSTTLTVGDSLMPVTANNNQSIYVVTSCTSGFSTCAYTVVPNWNSCQTAGCTATTADATYTGQGPNTCRADILLMDPTSAHIAP